MAASTAPGGGRLADHVDAEPRGDADVERTGRPRSMTDGRTVGRRNAGSTRSRATAPSLPHPPMSSMCSRPTPGPTLGRRRRIAGAGSSRPYYTHRMSILQRLLYALQSWRSIVAPKWLPPRHPWWPISRVAFYASCMVGTGLNAVMLSGRISSLVAFAYFAAGTGVTIAERRRPAPT